MTLKVESPSFLEGAMIPRKHTCDGEDVSPELRWSGAPVGTRSFALICDDPDAPAGTWVHWVLFNLPPELTRLVEAVPPDPKLKEGGIHGINDFRRLGYGGPCPPAGTHRYFFKLYALDCLLALEPGIKKRDLETAMKGHILEQAILMGRYRR